MLYIKDTGICKTPARENTEVSTIQVEAQTVMLLGVYKSQRLVGKFTLVGMLGKFMLVGVLGHPTITSPFQKYYYLGRGLCL